MSFDTSKELPCTLCGGTGKVAEHIVALREQMASDMGTHCAPRSPNERCLVCGGVGKFPGFDPKQILDIILTKLGRNQKRMLRKRFPHSSISDETLNGRAYYVWTQAHVHAGKETKAGPFAKLAVSGDPYQEHLDAVAQVLSDSLFGTKMSSMEHREALADVLDLGSGIENHVPNIDDMDEKELSDFWSKFHRASRKTAEDLVGERPRSTAIAATLAAYALDRKCAMALRKEGAIARAQTYEASMKLRYDQLPPDLRW